MRAGSPPRTSGIVRSIFSTSSRTIPSPARPPAYERLVGDLAGCYSRRINIQHRLVYEEAYSVGICVHFRESIL